MGEIRIDALFFSPPPSLINTSWIRGHFPDSAQFVHGGWGVILSSKMHFQRQLAGSENPSAHTLSTFLFMIRGNSSAYPGQILPTHIQKVFLAIHHNYWFIWSDVVFFRQFAMSHFLFRVKFVLFACCKFSHNTPTHNKHLTSNPNSSSFREKWHWPQLKRKIRCNFPRSISRETTYNPTTDRNYPSIHM